VSQKYILQDIFLKQQTRDNHAGLIYIEKNPLWAMNKKDYILPNYLLILDELKYVKKGSDNIRAYGTGNIIKEIHRDLKEVRTSKEVYKETHPRQTYFNWINGVSGIAIQDLYNLCLYWKRAGNKTEKEFNRLWHKIYLSANYFGCTNGKQIKLPKQMDNKLAYLLGVIMGDGHLAYPDKSYDKRTTYNSEVRITDGHKETFINLTTVFQELFGYTPKIYSEKSKINKKFYRFVIKSKPLHRFLMNICEIPTGNKSNKTSIPKIIKSSSLEIQKSFITGFFDADGYIGLKKGKYPHIAICQKNKEILLSIIKISKNYNLEWKGPHKILSRGDKISYSINLSNIKDIKSFLKHFPPYNPIKLWQSEVIWERINQMEKNQSCTLH